MYGEAFSFKNLFNIAFLDELSVWEWAGYYDYFCCFASDSSSCQYYIASEWRICSGGHKYCNKQFLFHNFFSYIGIPFAAKYMARLHTDTAPFHQLILLRIFFSIQVDRNRWSRFPFSFFIPIFTITWKEKLKSGIFTWKRAAESEVSMVLNT